MAPPAKLPAAKEVRHCVRPRHGSAAAALLSRAKLTVTPHAASANSCTCRATASAGSGRLSCPSRELQRTLFRTSQREGHSCSYACASGRCPLKVDNAHSL